MARRGADWRQKCEKDIEILETEFRPNQLEFKQRLSERGKLHLLKARLACHYLFSDDQGTLDTLNTSRTTWLFMKEIAHFVYSRLGPLVRLQPLIQDLATLRDTPEYVQFATRLNQMLDTRGEFLGLAAGREYVGIFDSLLRVVLADSSELVTGALEYLYYGDCRFVERAGNLRDDLNLTSTGKTLTLSDDEALKKQTLSAAANDPANELYVSFADGPSGHLDSFSRELSAGWTWLQNIEEFDQGLYIRVVEAYLQVMLNKAAALRRIAETAADISGNQPRDPPTELDIASLYGLYLWAGWGWKPSQAGDKALRKYPGKRIASIMTTMRKMEFDLLGHKKPLGFKNAVPDELYVLEFMRVSTALARYAPGELVARIPLESTSSRARTDRKMGPKSGT